MFELMTTSMALAYQDARLAEVTDVRPLRVARTTGPRLRERVLMHIGDGLIHAGLRLRQRYRPVIVAASQAVPSAAGKGSG
jgi:hypothetical protein